MCCRSGAVSELHGTLPCEAFVGVQWECLVIDERSPERCEWEELVIRHMRLP
jgi:hypothetical protein